MAQSQLDIFKEGALLLVEGIDTSDKTMLTDASELLAGADAEEIADFTFEESETGALGDPMILFTPGFADKIRMTDFTLVPLDPLDSLRYIGGQVSTVTRTIAPGAEAVFTFEGSDDINILCVASKPGVLKMDLRNSGKEFPATLDKNGYSQSAGLSVPAESESFQVCLKNTFSEPVSFVIAIQ